MLPALVGLICNVGIYLLVALAPPALGGRALRVTDLAIANSIQWMSHALIMLWLVRLRLGGLGGFGLGRLTFKAILSSLAMGGVVWLTINVVVSVIGVQSLLHEAIGVIGAATLGLIIYFGALILLKTPEVGALWQIARRRRVA